MASPKNISNMFLYYQYVSIIEVIIQYWIKWLRFVTLCPLLSSLPYYLKVTCTFTLSVTNTLRACNRFIQLICYKKLTASACKSDKMD